MSEKIRLLIADDHPLFRDGVAQSFANAEDIEIIAQAGTGEEAIKLVREMLPDVLLLDIAMPGMGGIATARSVGENWPIVNVIMLTVSEDQDDLMAALKAGARGYVLKGVSAYTLLHAVRSVAAGDVYISPNLAGSILFEMTSDKQPDPFSTLTEREEEILLLVAQGLTNREIGDQLYLAEKTVKHYMTNVLQKLQVRSRVEAALLAQKRSLGI